MEGLLSFILNHLPLTIAIIVGIYEVFVRIIPTIKNWSLLALIIEILKLVSDFLNRRKKK